MTKENKNIMENTKNPDPAKEKITRKDALKRIALNAGIILGVGAIIAKLPACDDYEDYSDYYDYYSNSYSNSYSRSYSDSYYKYYYNYYDNYKAD